MLVLYYMRKFDFFLSRRFFSAVLLALAQGITGHAAQFAVFYALEADINQIRNLGGVEIGSSASVGEVKIRRIRLGNHTLLAARMGSGCVASAISAEALLSRFRCETAYSLGPAGSLRDDLPVGSWHLVTNVIAWQSSAADPRTTLSPPAPPDQADGSRFPSSTLTVASGEAFLSTTAAREQLRARTGADAVDMNLSGLSAACANHRVPLVAWKIISDHADEEAPAAFRAFSTTYEGAGGAALARLLLSLPPDPADPLHYPAIGRILDEEAE